MSVENGKCSMLDWKAWGQLFRIPNTLTAAADIVAGFSLGIGYWTAVPTFLIPLSILAIASICLYWAGMVLNDVNDVDRDRMDRRRGPLVDERISWRTARRVGWGLLAMGIVLSPISVWLFSLQIGESLELKRYIPPTIVSFALAGCIVLYDSPIKKTLLGPVLMGGCRGLNMLLGVSLAVSFRGEYDSIQTSLGLALLGIVIGHALFVIGFTFAARKESKLSQSRLKLAMSWAICFIGVAFIAIAPTASDSETYQRLDANTIFPLLVGLLMFPWVVRVWKSILRPEIPSLIPAIKQSILSILFLDAAVALQFSGNFPGMLVCVLAIPTFLLGRYFRMT